MTWDYVAGFFDADGCVSFVRGRPMASFSQATRPDNVLREIQMFLKSQGIDGDIFNKKPHKSNRLPMADMQVRKHAHVDRILRAMLPMLIVKRDRAEQALVILEQKRLLAETKRQAVQDNLVAAALEYDRGSVGIDDLCRKYKFGTDTLCHYLRSVGKSKGTGRRITAQVAAQ